MHADLVGAPGFEPARDERGGGKPLERRVVGHRRPAARCDRNPLPVDRVPPDRFGNDSLVPPDPAADQRQVRPDDRMRLELGGERSLRLVGLGHHQQPGGVLVEPVHDPGPDGPADPGQVRNSGQERVHEGPRGVPGRRMYSQSGGLVHDEQIRILVDDVERNRFRLEPGRRRRRDQYAHLLLRPDAERRFPRYRVDQDPAVCGKMRRSCPRELGQALGDDDVEAPAGVRRRGPKLQRGRGAGRISRGGQRLRAAPAERPARRRRCSPPPGGAGPGTPRALPRPRRR